MLPELVPPILLSFHGFLPPILITILVILVIVFIIKSLLKFAIMVGAIALVLFIVWRMGWIPGF